MNVIDKIHMLKKILKEAGKLVTWQETIYTALHNIHADWIVSGTIAWGRLVANFPRTIAELLSDHNLAHHGLGTIVPHDALASLTEKAHGSLTGVTSNQHHTRSHDHSLAADGSPIAVAGVPNLPASKVTSGRFPVDRLPAMTSGKIWKGTGGNVEEVDFPVGVPSGVIAMWHGLIANIPSGWIICDGNSGTPNLLARFVQGVATAATNPGATGGEATHTLSLSELPGPGVGGILKWDGVGGSYLTSAGEHFSIGGGGQAHENRPPFYDVAFIMKT